MEFDARVVAGIAQHLAHGVDHAGALHRAEVHRRAVIDHFRGAEGARNNIADVGPVADLLTVAPDDKGVLPDEGARDHGNHGVVLVAALAVNREVAAAGGLQAEVAVVRLQRHFRHQLGPAVHVVGVIGRTHHVFGQVEDLRRVRLNMIGINTPR